jgi:hypothetical protein
VLVTANNWQLFTISEVYNFLREALRLEVTYFQVSPSGVRVKIIARPGRSSEERFLLLSVFAARNFRKLQMYQLSVTLRKAYGCWVFSNVLQLGAVCVCVCVLYWQEACATCVRLICGGCKTCICPWLVQCRLPNMRHPHTALSVRWDPDKSLLSVRCDPDKSLPHLYTHSFWTQWMNWNSWFHKEIFAFPSNMAIHRMKVNCLKAELKVKSQNYVTTDGQSASLSWC